MRIFSWLIISSESSGAILQVDKGIEVQGIAGFLAFNEMLQCEEYIQPRHWAIYSYVAVKKGEPWPSRAYRNFYDRIELLCRTVWCLKFYDTQK